MKNIIVGLGEILWVPLGLQPWLSGMALGGVLLFGFAVPPPLLALKRTPTLRVFFSPARTVEYLKRRGGSEPFDGVPIRITASLRSASD